MDPDSAAAIVASKQEATTTAAQQTAQHDDPQSSATSTSSTSAPAPSGAVAAAAATRRSTSRSPKGKARALDYDEGDLTQQSFAPAQAPSPRHHQPQHHHGLATGTPSNASNLPPKSSVASPALAAQSPPLPTGAVRSSSHRGQRGGSRPAEIAMSGGGGADTEALDVGDMQRGRQGSTATIKAAPSIDPGLSLTPTTPTTTTTPFATQGGKTMARSASARPSISTPHTSFSGSSDVAGGLMGSAGGSGRGAGAGGALSPAQAQAAASLRGRGRSAGRGLSAGTHSGSSTPRRYPSADPSSSARDPTTTTPNAGTHSKGGGQATLPENAATPTAVTSRNPPQAQADSATLRAQKEREQKRESEREAARRAEREAWERTRGAGSSVLKLIEDEEWRESAGSSSGWVVEDVLPKLEELEGRRFEVSVCVVIEEANH